MNQPLLSICIPTFNRAKLLRQCLETVTRQFADPSVRLQVEIVISDNASEDDTRTVVESFQGQYENIRYFRNERNMGMDFNIANSVHKATGKYCWNIGDDDLIQNGGLKLITDILAARDVSLLTINFHPYVDQQEADRPASFDNSTTEYVNDPEVFYDKGYNQGILGIFIFNRDEWLTIDQNNNEPYWGYYEVVLKMMGKTSLPFAYTNHPIVFSGQDYRWNTNGASLFVAIHNKRMMEKLTNYGYGKRFIKKEVDLIARRLPYNVLVAKSFGLPCTHENLKRIRDEFSQYPLQRTLATIAFFIPNGMVQSIKRIKHSFTR